MVVDDGLCGSVTTAVICAHGAEAENWPSRRIDDHRGHGRSFAGEIGHVDIDGIVDNTRHIAGRTSGYRGHELTMGGSRSIEVITKDCTALSDAEMGEMADLSAAGAGWEVGFLSKQAESWVLVSQAFSDGVLQGFVFSTLERIGGTPALVVGVLSVGRRRSRSAVLNALMHEQFHKARMAFPDEDVVVAMQMVTADPLEAFTALSDVRPWPETRANGEERAWGRRLAKRFGAISFDDRTMVALVEGDRLAADHESLKTVRHAELFEPCRDDAQRSVIVWGWAMAEFLDDFLTSAG